MYLVNNSPIKSDLFEHLLIIMFHENQWTITFDIFNNDI